MSKVSELKETRAGVGERSRCKIAFMNGVCRVADLTELTGASDNVVRRWIREFESEEVETIKKVRRNEFGVTDGGLRAHQDAIGILEQELGALSKELSKLRKDPVGYKAALASFMAVQKRLSELTGLEGMIAGHKALAVTQGKQEASKEPEKEKPAQPRKITPRVSGPIVPLD